MSKSSLSPELKRAMYWAMPAGMIAGAATYLVARWFGEEFWITVPLLGRVQDPIFSFIISGLLTPLAVAWFVQRFITHRATPRRDFILVSAVVLVLSSVSPLFVQAAASTALWFNLAHLAVAAAVMHFFFWALPGRNPAGAE